MNCLIQRDSNQIEVVDDLDLLTSDILFGVVQYYDQYLATYNYSALVGGPYRLPMSWILG